MAAEVTVPRLGWNMDEGVFVEWLKQDGDQIKAGDMLFSLEGEKSIQEIESFDSGILRISPAGPAEGDVVPVGAVLAYLCEPNEEPPFGKSPSGSVATSTAAAVNVTATVASATKTTKRRRRDNGKTISPRALRLANEMGVDWKSITGTGASGRIREADVAKAKSGNEIPGSVASSATRQVIAKRMLHASQNTAAVTLTSQADATNLVSMRSQFKAASTTAGTIPTLNDILVKLTATALSEHPDINSVWQGDTLQPSPDAHIGIAVDAPSGLVVPVLRDAGQVGLRQVAKQSASLIQRARERKLSTNEMQGGTFTITNLGAFGIDAFTPIINEPQVAILGIGRIAKLPTVLGNEIVPRDQMTLSLTFDHRALDGAAAAKFLQSLVQRFENPAAWLV